MGASACQGALEAADAAINEDLGRCEALAEEVLRCDQARPDQLVHAQVLLAACRAQRGQLQESMRLGLGLLDAPCLPDHPTLHARVLNLLGAGHDLLERSEDALGFYLQALALLRRAGTPADLTRVLGNLGVLQSRLGDDHAALERLVEAIDLAEANGLIERLPRLLINAAESHLGLGEPDRAEALLGRSEAVAVSLGHGRTLAFVWMLRGQVRRQQGQTEQAGVAFRRAIAAAAEVGELGLVVAGWSSLAGLLASRPETAAEALAAVEAGLAAREGIDADESVATLLALRSGLREAQGDLAGALADHRAMHELRERLFRGSQAERIASLEARHELERVLQQQAWLEREREILARSNERLVVQDQERRDLMATAAHDLRSPLTLVQLIGSSLSLGSLDPARVEQASLRLQRASDRMVAIIERHLGPEAVQGVGIRREAVDAQAVARNLVTLLQPVAEGKGIGLVLTGAHTGPVLADNIGLEQILDNLLTNALKYTPRGGRVVVRLHEEGGRRFVDIQDTGPGLGGADQEQLFERFRQGPARPTAGESSTGLGLYIARQLAEQLGATVRPVVGPEGGGACFRLTLQATRPTGR